MNGNSKESSRDVPLQTVARQSSDHGDIEENILTESTETSSQTNSASKKPSEQSLIDWTGPDDPDLPINWPAAIKWRNVLLVSVLTFLTPFASSMFAPAIEAVMEEMGTLNRDVGSFGVSIYLLGYAFGPLILAPCSELYGRCPVYHVCTVLFILTNVACGLSVSMPMLIVFRFLTGLVGACPLTVGPGTVADCFRQEERGRAMAVWTMPVLLGPCVGPAVGAYVSRDLGWRWNFWILIIMTGVVMIACFVFQLETHPPTLLRKKAQQLRKSGQMPQARAANTNDDSKFQVFKASILRPIKMLFLSPIIFGLSLLTAVAYGTLYLLFTTVTEVFRSQYGIVTHVGLIYLGFGCGQFAGLFLFGIVSDAIVKRKAKGGQMKPEYRLPPMIPGGAMIPIGLLLYGWTAHYRVFWFVPVIGTFFVGFGMISVFTPVGTYLVDAFPAYAASATAANTVFRSVGGALLPLAGPRMYETLGQGWGNTLLAGLSLGMMCMIWISQKYGERIRTHPRYQLSL